LKNRDGFLHGYLSSFAVPYFWHRCPCQWGDMRGGASLALEELVVQGKVIEMVQGEQWEEGEEW